VLVTGSSREGTAHVPRKPIARATSAPRARTVNARYPRE
jgi:hypothetical protein